MFWDGPFADTALRGVLQKKYSGDLGLAPIVATQRPTSAVVHFCSCIKEGRRRVGLVPHQTLPDPRGAAKSQTEYPRGHAAGKSTLSPVAAIDSSVHAKFFPCPAILSFSISTSATS